MKSLTTRMAELFAELRRRRVFRVAGAYLAGALVVLEGADLLLSPLGYGSRLQPVLVVLAIVGFPLAVAFAWAYDLTATGIRRTEPSPARSQAPGPPPPDELPLRRQLQVFGLFVVASLVAIGAGALLVRTVERPGGVERTKLAVFPFRPIGAAVEAWAEGAPDLLSTFLDGTEGFGVADPWALWRPLRPTPDTRPHPPAPEEAAELAARAGAGRFLLGSVVDAGDSVTVSLRLYEVGRAAPVHVFSVAGIPGDLAGAVRRVAVAVLGRLTRDDARASPPELAADPTESPEALKAYLAAREAMRRGLVDSASTAIDRAIALDSTFVLALVEAVVIKSWVANVRGEEFRGLLPLLDAAEPFADSVNERTRLRLAASRASVLTDGPAAMAAARRILEVDSTDLHAWVGLTYYLTVYGWQVGADLEDAREAAERVVRLDSTYVPGLTARAFLAVRARDPDDARQQLRRLELADTSGPMARGNLAGLRATLADEAAFRRMLPDLVALPRAALPSLIRHLRETDPGRARVLLTRLRDERVPGMEVAVPFELARLDAAEGWIRRVDSAAALPEFRGNGWSMSFRALHVAASLAGVDGAGAADAAARLAAFVPVDSANEYFNTRPVWSYGWVVGAYNAAFGDTTLARRWEAVFDTMPAGGIPPRWGAALAADIASRVAARRGDDSTALDRARDAFRFWSIHTENTTELMPEPAMRLNLAVLYQQAGMADSAKALLTSMVPPAAWLGFLTPRAHFELGTLALEEGDTETAALRFRRALELWGAGGPAVAEWREQARRLVAGELAAALPERPGTDPP